VEEAYVSAGFAKAKAVETVVLDELVPDVAYGLMADASRTQRGCYTNIEFW
jgi:hypothetical protein